MRSMPAHRRRQLAGLERAVHSFDLQREDFLAIIDGMEMDVASRYSRPRSRDA